MIYNSQGKEIDLSKITRVYPTAVVIDEGEEAHVSLEWADEKKDVVDIAFYALIFDFDKLGDEIKNRLELKYSSKEELIDGMKEVSEYFSAK